MDKVSVDSGSSTLINPYYFSALRESFSGICPSSSYPQSYSHRMWSSSIMIIIHDHCIWWSCMISYMIMYDDHGSWSYMMVTSSCVYIYLWWSYMRIMNADHIWWSTYMTMLFDDHVWWSYMIMYDDHVWWSYMMVNVWWSYMKIMNADHIWWS